MNPPFISIILPVLNEADRINEIIQHVRSLDHDHVAEIIVVDGDLPGSTINAIKDDGVITSTSARGRAYQMNCGAELALGEILLFLHADTLLPPDALARVREVMHDQHVVAGAFELGINSKRRVFRITERYVSLRTRLTRVPFGDQAIFIRKKYFEQIGGYCTIPLMEDVELMGRIKKRGDRVCIIPEKVLTSARRWEEEGILLCTFRNWMLQLLYVFGVSPERLKRWYKFSC